MIKNINKEKALYYFTYYRGFALLVGILSAYTILKSIGTYQALKVLPEFLTDFDVHYLAFACVLAPVAIGLVFLHSLFSGEYKSRISWTEGNLVVCFVWLMVLTYIAINFL